MESKIQQFQDTEKVELEDQFILRLPQEDADYVRCILALKPKKLKKQLKIDLNPETGKGTVIIGDKTLNCRLRKLPTIVESLKSYNHILFVKTADICQLLECAAVENGGEYQHGLAPPLKNVKKKRFRNCLINRDEASVNVQKELFYLLQADLEAVSTKFQIVKADAGHGHVPRENSQIELFGNILTDSEEETDSNIEEVE